MDRLDAAKEIMRLIEQSGDFTADLWAPEFNRGPVRIYLTIPAANWKKKARKIGFISIEKNGEILVQTELQSGTIRGLIPEIKIEPVIDQPVVGLPSKAGTAEDCLDQLEASEIFISAKESAREQG